MLRVRQGYKRTITSYNQISLSILLCIMIITIIIICKLNRFGQEDERTPCPRQRWSALDIYQSRYKVLSKMILHCQKKKTSNLCPEFFKKFLKEQIPFGSFRLPDTILSFPVCMLVCLCVCGVRGLSAHRVISGADYTTAHKVN